MSKTKIMIIVVIILALIAGGLYFMNQRNQEAATDETEDISAVPQEPTAEPTEEEVAIDEYSIEILNGSGVAGEAGRAQTLLEGYDVISTGNAESYDYEETVIQAGSDVNEQWLEDLQDALGANYTVQSNIEDLDTDSEADVVIIVGSLDEDGESLIQEEDTEDEDAEPTDGASATNTPTPSPTP